MEFHKALGLSSFCTFQEAVEMVHCSSIPTTIYGRVVPSPLPFEFVFASLCCQNLTFYEPFIDKLWSFAFMYRCVLVRFLSVWKYWCDNKSAVL